MPDQHRCRPRPRRGRLDSYTKGGVADQSHPPNPAPEVGPSTVKLERDDDGQPREDLRLAPWVQAVVAQWKVQGVRGRNLANLFAALLHELVVARTRGVPTDQIVGIEPGVVAAQFADTRTTPWTAAPW